jgi:hypothetical protein
MDAASDWVASGGKGALDFDGSNDYVAASNLPLSGNETLLTISAWIRPANVNTVKAIVGLGSEANGQRRYLLQRNAQIEANGFLQDVLSNANVLTANTWFHAVIVYTGYTLATGVQIFLNGALAPTSVVAGTTLVPFSGRTITLGSNLTGGENWAGQLDDIAIYNTALTANEVREIYRRGRGYGVFPEPDFDEGFAAAGFKAHWARRQSQLIGGGV